MDQNMHELSDEVVATKALSNKEMFGVLMERYEECLDRYLKRLGVAKAEDREDLLQDTFLKVYQNLAGFDNNLTFSSWIYRITHNEAVSFFRKRNVRPEGHMVLNSESALQALVSDDALSDGIDSSLNAEHITNALESLSAKYRTVLVLRYFEAKEYKEISDILKIPPGSVATLIHRAKSQLKSKLPAIT